MRKTDCILVVDDEAELRTMVRMVLERAGYQVLLAGDGQEALRLFQENPADLVLLDVMMPVMDGVETCRLLRKVSNVPVIFLTVRWDEEDLVMGFDAGAIDYIDKPFRPRELTARIQAALQRAPVRPKTRLTYLDLTLDPKTRQVRRENKLLAITPQGFLLLEYFLMHQGEVVSKADLLRAVWAYIEPIGAGNMVEAAIKRLRHDLQDDSRDPRYIRTVWRSGYQMGEKK